MFYRKIKFCLSLLFSFFPSPPLCLYLFSKHSIIFSFVYLFICLWCLVMWALICNSNVIIFYNFPNICELWNRKWKGRMPAHTINCMKQKHVKIINWAQTFISFHSYIYRNHNFNLKTFQLSYVHQLYWTFRVERK